MESLQRRNTYHREAHHGRDSQQDQETYSGLHSDIEQLKKQLRDMKRMMRISFDLQRRSSELSDKKLQQPLLLLVTYKLLSWLYATTIS